VTFVIDTNVILVANRQHAGVSDECARACDRRLQVVMESGRVTIDDRFRILSEYLNKTTPHTGKRTGDAFVKWLLQNKATPSRCDQVALAESPARGFETFPDDARLAAFDPPDRKFVAVAAAHADKPPVLQAADSKWLDWAPALADYAISVEFLCPADIEGFDAKKKRKGPA